MRSIRTRILSVVVACLVLGLVGAGSAYGASSWWHLTSNSRPTYMQPGQAKNEVQRLTVEGNEGHYVLKPPGSIGVQLEVGETPAKVQEALEEEYGSGNVHVTGGPGAGNNPYEVYDIEFLHGLTDQPVALMEASEYTSTVSKLEGKSETRGHVILSEAAVGRPDGQIIVTAVNLGDTSAEPSIEPIVLSDQLPSGLKPVSIEGFANAHITLSYSYPLECTLKSLSCVFTGKKDGGATRIPPYEQIQMAIGVNLRGGAESGEVNHASVTGGGTPHANAESALSIGEEPSGFHVRTYEMRPEEPGGAADTQAGSHPFQLTTTIDFNEGYSEKNLSGHPFGGSTPALSKDLHFNLPPGLIGNPTPFAQCPLGEFLRPENGQETSCPAQTAIGVARLSLGVPQFAGSVPFTEPLFNLAPSVGEPARFGFVVYGIPVLLTTKLRTGGDYGVTVNVTNISQAAEFIGSEVTFWGVPGEEIHNESRGQSCLIIEQEDATGGGSDSKPCVKFEEAKPPPLLSMPPSCTGAIQSTVEGDSWTEPQNNALLFTDQLPAMDGCNDLQFNPSIEDTPDGQAGSTPTGLAVTVKVPQEVSLNAEGLAESDVKDTTVTLPSGVALNPAAADGLMSCSEEQIALSSSGPSACPASSKIGLVKIKTPLLPNPLEGAAYLATQDANPFGSLVAIYVYVEDPVSGSRVKLAGEVTPDSVTGQIVSTFKNTPELPFETFELHFFGGDRAPLSTPSLCGAYTTTASVVSSSSEVPVTSSSTFDVNSGPNGTPCHNPLPFSPSLTAGTTSIQAGGFSPFTMTMSRTDGNQNLQAIKLTMPRGLSGTLATVKLCKEAQANAGTCGPESLIGHTIVSVGVGGDPFSVTGGEVFITEGYGGAPYGLSIVNPAKAGPFDLGKVIVRAKIEVDPITAALTITTNNSGPYKIPTILDGIPLQIQHVEVSIDRPGFTFNPTNCSPLAVGGTLFSNEGSSAAVNVPFQVTNCAVLAFKPKLTAKTSGKTSRTGGASLSVKLTYPAGPYDANIAKVKVDLPRQLPSRLTTLQKACPAQTFESNPAACPPESIVGHAKATTPVLPVSLEGPAYFVSHGGEEFPQLIVVLQGYGVTVHLVGSTFISKAGITSSTFKQVPDVPVGTFELTLPQGKYSALAANGNLCTVKKLTMPTSFVGQNGATINTTTPITPTGCAKKSAKKTKHAAHKAKKKGSSK